MSQTPETPKERRRAQVRASVARLKERLDSLSPIEQAAWKARASLGEDYDPYTPEERQRLEQIRALRARLEAEASSLNASLVRRYGESLKDNPALAILLAEALSGSSLRVELKPH